jgi:uncharacterized Zn finger protein
MIQIQSKQQFERAAARLQKERMKVRRAEPHMWAVTNTAKGVTYHVRFTRNDSGLFASCDCKAGLRHGRAPLMCKHVAAAVMVLRGIQQARQAAAALALGSRLDGDD